MNDNFSLTDILDYIPKFQDRIFVILLSGYLMESMNWSNFARQIATLQSLGIRIILVHGARPQIDRICRERKIASREISNYRITNNELMDIVSVESNKLSMKLFQSLSNQLNTSYVLKPVMGQFFRAKPLGIIKGTDTMRSGQVVKIFTNRLEELLQLNYLPLINSVGYDNEGNTYNIRSVDVASAIAVSMKAAKILYLIEEDYAGERFAANSLELDEVLKMLESEEADLNSLQKERFYSAYTACKNGVERAHFIDGRKKDAFLKEIFTTQGEGLLISNYDYHQIRKAENKDVGRILELIRNANELGEFRHRIEEDVRSYINDFYVFELDNHICSAVAFHRDSENRNAELAALVVEQGYRELGIGKKMVEFLIQLAKKNNLHNIVLSTTRTLQFFRQFGFTEMKPDEVPEFIKKNLEADRNSVVLGLNLKDYH